jgi:hypothetical protein
MIVIPEGDFIATSRRCLPGANVRETGLSCPKDRPLITDFMEAPAGDLAVTVWVDVRFDDGQVTPDVEVRGDISGCPTLRDQGFHLHVDGPGSCPRDGRAMVQELKLSQGLPRALLLRYEGIEAHRRAYDPLRLLDWTRPLLGRMTEALRVRRPPAETWSSAAPWSSSCSSTCPRG